MALADSTKDVALTPQPKAKRQSFRAAVRQLESRLFAAQHAKAEAQAALDQAAERLNYLTAECSALADAYDLVKPQPRTRKGAK